MTAVRWRVLIVAAALVAVALLAVGSLRREPRPPPPPTGQAEDTVVLGPVTANDRGIEDVAGMQEAAVEAGDFYFEPTVLTGERGAGLRLEVTSTSAARHTVTSAELGVDRDVPPGGTVTLQVTFPEEGILVFFCRYHQDRGMAGALVGG